MVLGYIDGANPTYRDLVEAYKGTRVIVAAITVDGHDPDYHAEVIDCELGAATPIQAAGWAVRKIQRGERPTIYGGADFIDATIREIEAIHYSQSLASYWLAHYVQVSPSVPALRYPVHLPRGRQAWQFADNLATPEHHGFDVSVVKSSWPRSVGLTPSKPRAIEVRW